MCRMMFAAAAAPSGLVVSRLKLTKWLAGRDPCDLPPAILTVSARPGSAAHRLDAEREEGTTPPGARYQFMLSTVLPR